MYDLYGTNQLFVALVGTDDHIWVGYYNGTSTLQNQVRLGDTSINALGLTDYTAGNELYLAWTGMDSAHHLNIMSSYDGMSWFGKVTLGDTASHGPALAEFTYPCGDQPDIVWGGTDANSSLNVACFNTTTGAIQGKTTLRDMSVVEDLGLAYNPDSSPVALELTCPCDDNYNGYSFGVYLAASHNATSWKDPYGQYSTWVDVGPNGTGWGASGTVNPGGCVYAAFDQGQNQQGLGGDNLQVSLCTRPPVN